MYFEYNRQRWLTTEVCTNKGHPCNKSLHMKDCIITHKSPSLCTYHLKIISRYSQHAQLLYKCARYD